MKTPAVSPSFEVFTQTAKTCNRIPVCLAFQSDLETPLSVYLKLAKGPNGFLLESVEKHELVARYSIVGFEPTALYEAKGTSLTITQGKKKSKVHSDNPLLVIKQQASAIRQAPLEGATGFLGGFVGTIAYDSVRYFEKLPSVKPDVLGLPDMFLMATDHLALFDHLKRTLRLIVNVPVDKKTNLKKAYAQATAKLAGYAKALEKPIKGVAEIPVTPVVKPGANDLFGFSANQTQADYEGMVTKSKEYIKAGDIIQVVGSLRFEKPVSTDAVTLYRVLRRLNPSPYMYLLKLNGVEIVGSSPEMMIKVQNGVVETRPIAGSRPRGKSTDEDTRLGEELLQDEKELAEHVMLVDLARNDLGRVCDYGTVKVNQFKRIERYSHIMHIVSDVTGELKKGQTAYDAFQSCFPAGTLSGAPKIRAMEIIEELEPSHRGAYGGAIVAFGYDGNMDSAITIRTAVLKKKGAKTQAYVQAGAGLVADSVPATEYIECCNKARAVLMAISEAETQSATFSGRGQTAKENRRPKSKSVKGRKGGKK